jgi:hypothetical protein
MRTLLLTVALALVGTSIAQAHWPVTYVGSPEIHRFDGDVRQVTLAQPHIEKATSGEGQRLDLGESKSASVDRTTVAEFEMQRYRRAVQQVTLVTSADERVSELLRSSEPNAEYGISIGSFLREPDSAEQLFRNAEQLFRNAEQLFRNAEQLFRNDEVFAPELERPSNRYFTINGVSR